MKARLGDATWLLRFSTCVVEDLLTRTDTTRFAPQRKAGQPRRIVRSFLTASGIVGGLPAMPRSVNGAGGPSRRYLK